MQLADILKAPVITEKSTVAQGQLKYTFRVNPDANKIEIAQAVQTIYGVNVASVNILPVRKKERLVGRGRTITKRKMSKKAIVTLEPKQSIDFNKLKIAK